MPEMYEHPDLTPVAAFLHKAIDASGKTQRQIAQESGFRSPNFLSMLKHGAAKFPLEKVLPTAKSLRVDPAQLMRLVLEQYCPRYLHTIEEIFGLVISQNEKHLVLTIRRLTYNGDPAFDEIDVKHLLENRA